MNKVNLVVIGKEAKYVLEDNAQDYISGYCVVNDLSKSYEKLVG